MNKNKNGKSLVSIIMPAYNAEKYIYDAIMSALIQTYYNFELIIINDGSTDTTEQIIKKIGDKRIIYIKNEKNIGLVDTLNKGITIASGEYIARLDSDDLWLDEKKLELQVEFLKNNLDYGLLGTNAIIISEYNNEELSRTNLPLTNKDLRRRLLGNNQFIHSSVLFRKQLTLNCGGYTSNYKGICEDYDLWLKISLHSKITNLPIFATAYRKTTGSITSKTFYKEKIMGLKIACKYLRFFGFFGFVGILERFIRLLIPRKLSLYLRNIKK